MSRNLISDTSEQRNGRLCDLPGFVPNLIDSHYLQKLRIGVKPPEEVLQELRRGSKIFIERYRNKRLLAEPSYATKEIPPAEVLRTHRYTSRCPIDVLEIDPMVGCSINCLYCLVTDGDHSSRKIVYENYGPYLKRKLEENRTDHIYYFAPRTEPFQEPTLRTGVAHNVIREFIRYFKKHPESKSRVFIISKAGKEELQYEHNGDSILELMRELGNRLTYDTSISVMPQELYPIMEPRAQLNENRLESIELCQENKISANRAVVQPIIPPFLTDKTMDRLMKQLKEANIVGFKPEFLTLSIQNLSWLGQLIGYFDRNLERKLYECYLAPENINNVKHRNRVAPERRYTHDAMLRLKKHADKYGLYMNICNWVRSESNITQAEIPVTMRECLIGTGHERLGVCKPV